MCGWPSSGYYCNLGAIDSNPLFLLVWKLIIPLHADRHVFTRDDLQSWYKKLWVCRSSYWISLSARLGLFLGGPERPLRVNRYTLKETKHKWVLADAVLCRAVNLLAYFMTEALVRIHAQAHTRTIDHRCDTVDILYLSIICGEESWPTKQTLNSEVRPSSALHLWSIITKRTRYW